MSSCTEWNQRTETKNQKPFSPTTRINSLFIRKSIYICFPHLTHWLVNPLEAPKKKYTLKFCSVLCTQKKTREEKKKKKDEELYPKYDGINRMIPNSSSACSMILLPIPNPGDGQLHVEENQESVIKSGMWSSASVSLVQAKKPV
jgi:hypothetical protein